MSQKKDKKPELSEEERMRRGSRTTTILSFGIIIVTVLILLFAGIYLYIDSIQNHSDSTNTTDAFRFKNEYESLNGKKDQEGNLYPELTISKQNPILYISSDEVLKLLDSGTGIIYIGSPKNSDCREIIPILMSVSAELGVDEVYYFDATSIRDEKERNPETNEIETIIEGTEEYYDIVSRLEEYLPTYEGLEDETIKRLYFPTVVAVKNGEVVASHTGSIDEDGTSEEELKNIYKDMIEKTRN